CEEPDLVLADFAEEFGGEAEFFEEVEDLGGAVMAGRVVGRAGEAVRARAVGDAASRWIGHGAEFAEPAGHDGAERTRRRDPYEPVPLAQLAVLVAAAHDVGIFEPLVADGEGDDVEVVVCVDEEFGAVPAARFHDVSEPAYDARVQVEDGRDEGGCGPVVDGAGESFGHGVRGRGRDLDDLDSLFGEAIELAAERVVLAVGRDEAGPFPERERGDESDDEVVSVRGERNLAVPVAEEPGVAPSHPFGAAEGEFPLLVDVFRRVDPGAGLSLEGPVRPGLVRVAGQEEPVRDIEAPVVGRQGVRARVELFRSDHRVRTRSGGAPSPGPDPGPEPEAGAGGPVITARSGPPTARGTRAGGASTSGSSRLRPRRSRAGCRSSARPS